jgi:hypothetical protein
MSAPDEARLAAPATRRRRLLALLRAIARHRRMAAPLSWMALAGLVLALGVTAQVLLGWRWWLVVAVLAVVAEAGVVATSLTRSGEREQFADELLAIVAPGPLGRRRARRQAERLRSAPFPLYGLDRTWPGPRFLAGLATRQGRGERRARTTGIELGHGDPLSAGGPLVLVEVASEEPLAGADWRQDLTGRLTATAAAAPGATSAPGAAAGAPGTPPGPTPAPGGPAATSWRRVQIPVDGAPVVFDLVAAGNVWVARAERGGLVLTLTGRDIPPTQVAIARVTDPDRYLPGACSRHRRRKTSATSGLQ